MGFCTSCGELANTTRCPRCKGKVSTAAASGLSNRDAWSATYLDKPQSKTYAPNLSKLTKKKSFDSSLTSEKSYDMSTISSTSSIKKEEPSQSKIGTTKVRSREGKCDKCFSTLNLESVLCIEFNSKHFHRSCFTCETCSIRLNKSGFEADGKLQCKDCYDKLTASTNSSPSIVTPDETPYNLDLKNSILETKPNRNVSINRHRATLSLPAKDLETKTENISDTLKLMNLETKSPTQSEGLSLVSPSYSKTFQNLQASVNKTNSPATIRGRPRNVSEASSGLSFADLMASRRGKDFKGPTFSRRPISMISLDAKNKRTSMPVQPKEPINNTEPTPPFAPIDSKYKRSSLYIKPEGPSIPPINPVNPPLLNNRLSLSKHRPTSFSFSEKQKNTIIPDAKLNNLTQNESKEKETPKTEGSLSTEKTAEPQSVIDSIKSEFEKDKESLSSTIPKKLNCNKCEKSISDTWFRLLDGRLLHRECFTCRSCNKVFEDGKYSVYNEEEYHAECLLQMTLSPMSDITAEPEDLCDRCNLIITGPCFTLTNGRQYHPKCFICFGCDKQFDQGTYVSQGGKEYHRECLPKKDQVLCAKCSKFIDGVFVTNNGSNYHSECFKCTGCRRVITPSTPFGEVSQQPYCEPCLIQQHSSRQTSFAVSAARQEQRRSKSTSFPLQS